MRFLAIAVSALAGTASALKVLEHDKLAKLGLQNLAEDVAKNGSPSPGKCTLKNAARRKEWSLLARDDKLNYIDAVRCMHSRPGKTPKSVAPGARTIYDDFIVTHISATYQIHATANFLVWHRYYLHAYEQILRNECGYRGYLPYFNWSWWSDAPGKSPLFDGKDTSIGDGGSYVPGRPDQCVSLKEGKCLLAVPPGQGGGCISGPFRDWQMNLGPIGSLLPGIKPNPQEDGLGFNPRCIRRDVNKIAAQHTTDAKVMELINGTDNVLAFQQRMQGDVAAGILGVHAGGHYTVGGDAGTDFFNSPSDPAFFFHHAQIDRIWWIWQTQDLEKRRNDLQGTITFMNRPPSRNGTLDDVLSLGPMLEGKFPNITNGDGMSTVGGPFCYVYEDA